MPRPTDEGKDRMTRTGFTRAQCRAARNAVGMSQMALAKAAGVSRPVVQEFEASEGRVPIENNLRAIRTALETKGVAFQAVGEGRAAVIFDDPDARSANEDSGSESSAGSAPGK